VHGKNIFKTTFIITTFM